MLLNLFYYSFSINQFYFTGCWAVVLGENDSHLILWEHCTGVLIKKIHCPRNGAILQCIEEDQVS